VATLVANSKLILAEDEAAELLGLKPWQLRDLRLTGKIGYSRIVGNRVRYTLDDLLSYVRHHHRPGKDAKRHHHRPGKDAK
jgi:hypothetical protein